MDRELLKKARQYEIDHRPGARDLLPCFHATGGIGWINDPNGFSIFQGQAHLLFQYYPYDVKWGPMHWGHARTTDFIRWEHLPAALAPDEDYDRDGCFSGSAVELPNGRQLLMYTGVQKRTLQDGGVDEFQTQCVAVGDGRDYEKSPLNPVIDESMLPEGGSHVHFRDPKIWMENGGFAAIAADLDADGLGQILRYRSEDGFHWRYDGVLSKNDGSLGEMWECPDFFPLDEKAVLIHSAHDMQTALPEFHPGDGTVCHIGELDKEGRLLDEGIQTLDYGLDFYAPQTLETVDGRRILIAWMQCWASVAFPPKDLPFFGQMTLPRELFLKGGRLCQRPVRELERFRRDPVRYEAVRVGGQTLTLPGIKGRCLDMTLRIRPGKTGLQALLIRLAEDERYYIELRILPQEGQLTINRLHSGWPADVNHLREMPAPFTDGVLTLRLLLDRWSLELFAGEGEYTAAQTVFTPQTAVGISFKAEGEALIDIEKYEIKVEKY